MITILAIICLTLALFLHIKDSDKPGETFWTIFLAVFLGMNFSVGLYKLSGRDGDSWDTMANKAKKECEAAIPRNQECAVVVVATPPKPE